MKVRKQHGRTGTLVLESVQENSELLRRAVQARDATAFTHTTTEPIKSDTAMPTPIPTLTPTTAMDPDSTVTMMVVMLVTAKQHNTKQHEREEPEVKRMEEGDKGGKEEMGRREEIGERQQRTEEDRKKRDKVEEDDATTKEVHTQPHKDDTMHYQSTLFNWVMDVEESIGPNPVGAVRI
jgi:hypothetical protein